MKLSVLERVLLGNMLANYKGSFTNLKLVRKGREAVSFNDIENQKLKFVDAGSGGISWDPMASAELSDVNIEFDVTMTNIIKGLLRKMNSEEQLTEQHFSLYEKFIETE